jgi:3-hydroxyisobutyrate dehydrogenase-like beta-hydroxyacid dehydrogenase
MTMRWSTSPSVQEVWQQFLRQRRCTFRPVHAASSRVAAEPAHHGQDYVAAPVLGNPDFARAEAFVPAGGPHAALEKVRPVLDRLCQRVFVIAENASLANLVKLGANVLTATTLECMGEVLALLR